MESLRPIAKRPGGAPERHPPREALAFLANIRGPFDLVLLDPPFHQGLIGQVLPALQEKLAPGGVILAESEREAELPERAGTLVRTKQYFYGKIMVSRYEREEQA